MFRRSTTGWLAGLLACWAPLTASSAAPDLLFKDDFESAMSSSPNPVLSWKPPFSSSNEFGMMFGKGDIYERSTEKAYTGAYSLRLNFDGRNGFCNTCGNDSAVVKEANGGSSFSVNSWQGIVPTSDPLRPVFNKADNWSRWQIGAISGTSAHFSTGKPARNDMNGAGLFRIGQELKIARACGVNGNIGRDINRRSDCDLAVNYLQGLNAADFPYGGVLAKRLYFYVPLDTVMPSVALKLGYTTFKQADGKSASIYTILAVHRERTVEVDALGLSGKYGFTKVRIESGRWYYFEELFHRETGVGKSDGTYTLYLAAADEADPKPVFRMEDVKYGSLSALSIVGNWQHWNDAKGYIYFDEVGVAKGRLGPVVQSSKSSPPAAPILMVD